MCLNTNMHGQSIQPETSWANCNYCIGCNVVLTLQCITIQQDRRLVHVQNSLYTGSTSGIATTRHSRKYILKNAKAKKCMVLIMPSKSPVLFLGFITMRLVLTMRITTLNLWDNLVCRGQCKSSIYSMSYIHSTAFK